MRETKTVKLQVIKPDTTVRLNWLNKINNGWSTLTQYKLQKTSLSSRHITWNKCWFLFVVSSRTQGSSDLKLLALSSSRFYNHILKIWRAICSTGVVFKCALQIKWFDLLVCGDGQHVSRSPFLHSLFQAGMSHHYSASMLSIKRKPATEVVTEPNQRQQDAIPTLIHVTPPLFPERQHASIIPPLCDSV